MVQLTQFNREKPLCFTLNMMLKLAKIFSRLSLVYRLLVFMPYCLCSIYLCQSLKSHT